MTRNEWVTAMFGFERNAKRIAHNPYATRAVEYDRATLAARRRRILEGVQAGGVVLTPRDLELFLADERRDPETRMLALECSGFITMTQEIPKR